VGSNARTINKTHRKKTDLTEWKRCALSLFPGLFIAVLLLLLAAGLISQLAFQSGTDGISVGPRFFRTIGWTTLQASLSTVFSIAIGTVLAWALSHQHRFIGRNLYIALLSSALVLPTLVIVLGLVTLLGRSGWVNDLLSLLGSDARMPVLYGLGGILVAHCYFNASFAARSLLGRFESIPVEQRKLARSLGLTPWQRFRLIELPAIAASLPRLAMTIFLLCFTSFAIVLTLGGSPKYNTFEVSIYEAIKLDFDLGRALGLALTQLCIGAFLVIIGTRFKRDNTLIAIDRNTAPWTDKGGSRTLQVIILVLFGTAFALPLLAVLTDAACASFQNLVDERSFRIALFTSLLLALSSAIVVVVISVLLCSAITTLTNRQRLGNQRGSTTLLRLLNFSTTLYLAVPSLVLGLGFFLLARRLGGDYYLWALCALITANLLMVLPFAVAILAPAMTKSANRYDKLAWSLGIKRWSRWRLIESALIHREIAYVAAIAFCMSLGDLGVIALFGSQDFITLPWLLYQKTGSYRTDDAAGIAAIMLVLTLAVFVFLPALVSRIVKTGAP